jgi:hypothetical protein
MELHAKTTIRDSSFFFRTPRTLAPDAVPRFLYVCATRVTSPV